MKRIAWIVTGALAAYVVLALGLYAFIGATQLALEPGRAEGALRTFEDEGKPYESRVIVIDDGDTRWVAITSGEIGNLAVFWHPVRVWTLCKSAAGPSAGRRLPLCSPTWMERPLLDWDLDEHARRIAAVLLLPQEARPVELRLPLDERAVESKGRARL